MKKKLFAGLVFVSLMMGIVHADPVSYVEPTTDDILWDSFTLDIGTNTIEGWTSMIYDGSSHTTDLDPLKFVVLPGQELVSALFTVLELEYVNNLYPTSTYANQSFRLFKDNLGNPLSDHLNYNLLSDSYPNTVGLFSGITPLGEGNYFYQQGSGVANSDSWTNHYQITFEVAEIAPVPVPGAVLLGMIGLSIAGVKLRKHA